MSSYQRWTRDQEDEERLPHGMVRTAYDADTGQYTFRDTTDGTRYLSAPGAAYGTLVPAATATFPKTVRTTGGRTVLQAYDRPVIFADDIGQMRSSPQPSMGHKRNPSAPESLQHSSFGSARKQSLKRCKSFSDFVPPHLIGRAPDSPDEPTATATATTWLGSAWAGGALVKSAPPSPPPPPHSEKKQKPAEWSSSPSDPLLSLPTLSSSQRPLRPKDYPASSYQQSGETRVPHVAMRLTARVLGRTLNATKRSERSHKGQSADNGWVVV